MPTVKTARISLFPAAPLPSPLALVANKVEVKKAVEEIFDRKVESVKIINVRRKAKKMGRYEGFTAAVRKAIVTLEKGQKPLDVFEI